MSDGTHTYTPASGGTGDEDVRTGMSSAALARAITDHLQYSLGRPSSLLTPSHYYHALALAVRDRMQHRWTETTQTYLDLSRKVAVYLSAEFLLGPHLGNNLLNLQIEDEARAALDNYAGEYRCLADFAEELTRETGTEIPKALEYYIDWAAMGRDLELNGDVFAITFGFDEVHVFWSR